MTPCTLFRFLNAAAAMTVAVAASFGAMAAPHDALPDAVLGKPSFTAGTNGAPSATHLLTAAGMAEDPVSGELWVVDLGASRVLRFSSAKAFANGEAANLVLGQPGFTSEAPNRGGAPAANTLRYPTGIAIDARRNLYVADSDNHRVLMFSPPFTSGMAARAVLGQQDYTSNLANRGTGPDSDRLDRPVGLAADSRQGTLWIADQGNSRVVGFRLPLIPASQPLAFRVIGQADFQSRFLVDPAPNTLGRPTGLFLDFSGQLWVTDIHFNRVTAFPPSEQRANGSAAAVLCQQGFDTGDAGVSATRCNQPTGVAVDGEGRIHVADQGNNRVIRIDFRADGAAAWLGQPSAGANSCNAGEAAPKAETLCGPFSVLLDRQDNLLVADNANGRVLRYDLPAPHARPRVAAASPDEIARGSARFALVLEGQGFHENTRAKIDGATRPVTYLGPGRLAVSVFPEDTVGAGPLVVQLSNDAPGGGDSLPFPVARYDRVAGDRFADRVLGQPNRREGFPVASRLGEVRVGLYGPGLVSTGTISLAIDARTGRVFASMKAPIVHVRSWPGLAGFQNGDPADVIIGAADPFDVEANVRSPDASNLSSASVPYVTVDDAGRLYVSDSARHRVLRFDPPFVSGMAAVRVFGQRGRFDTSWVNHDPAALAAPSPTSLYAPSAVVARGNRLFIADNGNRRVLVFENPDASDAAVAAIGQNDLVSAVPGNVPSASRLANIFIELAVDAGGRLFVSDNGFNRVLRFSPPFTSGMPAGLVIGQADFTSLVAATSARGLALPAAIATDNEGNLFVADGGNKRVLKFAAPLSTGMAASAVLGQAGFDTRDGGAGEGGLANPSGLALDEAGNVLVADSANARILAYDRPFGVETSKRLVNIATRMPVLTGNDVLIGGFIIGGTAPKRVVIRARGPSLVPFGIPNALADPLLQLFSGATPVAVNDNWRAAANVTELQATGFAPAHEFESAILATLNPGAYTAIVSGVGGATGVGIVEVFEVDAPASPLVNIATRGRVFSGDDVMIGGFVIQGDSPQTVIVRARGPSLAAFGVPGALANPLLQLFAGTTPIATNDDWTAAPNAAAIQASGFAPGDGREAAILVTLQPGAYTAVVSGAGGATGVAIVEVFVP